MAVLDALSASLKRNQYVLLLAALALIYYVGWTRPAAQAAQRRAYHDVKQLEACVQRARESETNRKNSRLDILECQMEFLLSEQLDSIKIQSEKTEP